MRTGNVPRMIGLLVSIGLLAGCGGRPIGSAAPAGAADPADPVAPRVMQSGAPGEPSRAVPAAPPGTPSARGHVAADARFMRDMIAHHAQAVEMTGMVAERTTSREIRLLAERISLSQDDEIALMTRWLQERREPLPDPHAHHAEAAAGHAMPGMLTRAELDALAAARGEAFDRLFLEFMIRHHQGALEMVAALFAEEGGGQEAEVFQFAGHVDSDQRMEIARMQRMRNAAP